MHIRCERCATVYQLDERILPPGGAPVQCSRCQHVFHAFPPRAAARTLAGPPPIAPVPEAAPVPPPAAAPAPAPAPRRGRRDDTLADFAARVRRQSLWRWLGPVLLAMAGAGGYGAWAWRARQVDPVAAASREEGAALLARDDTASLEKATAAFAQASRIAPRLVGARADGALVRVLLAAGLRDDAAALEGVRSARAELEPLRRRARALQDEAYAELRGLVREHAADPAVERALAVYYAFDGNSEQSGKLVRNARASRQADAWIELAEAAADALGTNARDRRERAVARLGPLAAAHPEILRARMLLAAAQVDLGRRDAAVATLDSVLAANPGHDRAQRMRDWLLQTR